jgi:hypothetical protein
MFLNLGHQQDLALLLFGDFKGVGTGHVRFAVDSPLEEAGFELSAPPYDTLQFVAAGTKIRAREQA